MRKCWNLSTERKNIKTGDNLLFVIWSRVCFVCYVSPLGWEFNRWFIGARSHFPIHQPEKTNVSKVEGGGGGGETKQLRWCRGGVLTFRLMTSLLTNESLLICCKAALKKFPKMAPSRLLPPPTPPPSSTPRSHPVSSSHRWILLLFQKSASRWIALGFDWIFDDVWWQNIISEGIKFKVYKNLWVVGSLLLIINISWSCDMELENDPENVPWLSKNLPENLSKNWPKLKSNPTQKCLKNCPRNYRKIIFKWSRNRPENVPKSSQNHPEICPKITPKLSQNYPKIIPKLSKICPKIISKSSKNFQKSSQNLSQKSS